MTLREKNEIIEYVVSVLEIKLVVDDESSTVQNLSKKENLPEMLTIKECAQTVCGLSEHTIRQLVKQNKIKYIRTGAGKNGKILISKSTLIDYLNGTAA